MTGRNIENDELKINYENLSNAIVLQAVQDFRYHQRKIYDLKKKQKTSHNFSEIQAKIMIHKGHIESIERFFESDWFRELTHENIDGKRLFRKVKYEFFEEYRKNSKKTRTMKTLKGV